jgi:hypothetical protein
MVLNVSDVGMAISMAIPVSDEAYSNLHVRMNGLPQSIEVHGRMAWSTKSKKRAGIQLVDISDEQRAQIREWLAQEGVRDVNLIPRVSEPAASILPAGAAISPSLLDESGSNMAPVAAPAASNPEVPADSRASLLVGLGGTPPEFLGPAQDEPAQDQPVQDESSFTQDNIAETRSSQVSNPAFVGFRENEWDLASITMVPRKRSKPEGLSALALLLLWIAIPSFGIGIIVGRRPLQQWLSRTNVARKNVSRVATREPQILNARDQSPDITSSDFDASGSQSIPAGSVETPAIAGLHGGKSSEANSDATKSFVSTPAFVDTKLLNSMSTQELRALKSRASATPPENANAAELSKVDSKAKPNSVPKDVFSSRAADVKPIKRTNTPPPSTNAPTNVGNASAQRGDSKNKFPVLPAIAHDTQSIAAKNEASRVQEFSKQNRSDQIARTISVDSGVNASTTNHSSVGASNVAAPHSPAVNETPGEVSRTTSRSTASLSSAPATQNSTTHQNAAGSTTGIQAAGNGSIAPIQSVNHSDASLSRTAGNSTATSSPVSDANRNNNTGLTASKNQRVTESSSAAARAATLKSGSGAASDASPRIAPNVRPSMTSTATAGGAAKVAPNVYTSPSSRSIAPSAASNLAPVNAQSPLHGVMLVARKNNEAFLLRLPVESVAAGRSASVEMQRFVMVPAESRWHHHGPIVKLLIGELLTEVAGNQAETASNARPGDAVTVRAFVDKNGAVRDLKPVSGRLALMPRVTHDLREWQFDQTLIDGKPVESEVNITVVFRSGSQMSRTRETQAQNSFKS